MIVTIVSELILNIRKSKELIKKSAKRFINGIKINSVFSDCKFASIGY
jgi:hypothetical protein